jgi:3-deoxy-D-manno-octulosonic-acid transferase
VLEAAVYSKPVLFGNHYTKYHEAVELVKSGGALPFSDQQKNGMMLTELINGLLENKDEYSYCSRAAGNFVLANQGATARIISYIQEKRLLTS